MTAGKATTAIVLAASSAMLGGCFTGVESTPRINASDVKRERAAGVSPESMYLADVAPQAPSAWQSGKVFRVTDDRISRIFTSSSDNTDNMKGTELLFHDISRARSLTGDDAAEIHFTTRDGRNYFYRINGMSVERIDTLSALDIPFTIDMRLVGEIDSIMRGKDFFVRTPAWYDASGNRKENGLRHIKVHIDSVVPGDAYFPALVCFSVPDSTMNRRAGGGGHAVFMSVGKSKAATRNFDVLFSFDSPRKQYPEIKDDVWDLIISSKVRDGMTRDECRLALGAPPEVLRTPSYGGMREVWSYSDGVFLIFEDGYLTRFRL
ncbi:MAG: hypothetical protein J6J93_00475 [Muribaculaceae bacterium]|nr:hypothetical protein [Muribaculaceae bacterium]